MLLTVVDRRYMNKSRMGSRYESSRLRDLPQELIISLMSGYFFGLRYTVYTISTVWVSLTN
jgi:hypothetical protein